MLNNDLPSECDAVYSKATDRRVVLGKITSAHGVKGWVKVYSWTNPMTNIFIYPEWWLCFSGSDKGTVKVKVEETCQQGQGLAVRFEGFHDRDTAKQYVNAEVFVNANVLPELKQDEYYWYQLEGLTVFAQNEQHKPVNIGKVHHLIDTGANDVMVVRSTNESIDDRERLIPWIEEQVVLSVELANKTLRVEWDPDF